VRGTSFAAPIVAAMLATQMPDLDADAAHAVIARLALSALDLGPRGVDPIYGYGLVGESWRVPLDIIQRTP
jgi:hypothetical protein